MSEKLILVLYTTHQTMRVEKLFKSHRIRHRLIPKPSGVNPGCGIAITFYGEDVERVKKVLEDENINYEGIYSGEE